MLRSLYRNYLDREVLEGFDRYKYSCKDTSPLSNYVLHPFWNKVVTFCPTNIAPNLLTLVGFICCLGHYIIPAIFDYDFRASDKNSDHPIPSWAWALTSFLLFASHTLDGIDGKQARRTGTSSPLGELFDHGCDAWAAVFIATTFYSTFGRNEDSLSISEFRMYGVMWSVFFTFHLSHWEKYNTGIMYLPWGYDISMVGGTILYLLTSIFGYKTWKISLPGGGSPGPLLEFCLYFGCFCIALPVCLKNIYASYKDGTGKMRSFPEMIRPMVSILIALVLCCMWAHLSPNQVLQKDTRIFFYVTGTLCANLSCRLIIAQMSNTRCELINWFIIPLSAVVFSSILIPGLPSEAELFMLYLLAVGYTIFHCHFGICVVIQMARHLKIDAFRIKDLGDVRLLSSQADTDVANDNSDDLYDDDIEDANDMEVIIASDRNGLANKSPATLQV